MGSSRMPEFCQKEKRVGLHSAVFRELVLGPKGLGPTLWRKAAGTAKVRLGSMWRTGAHHARTVGPEAAKSDCSPKVTLFYTCAVLKDISPSLHPRTPVGLELSEA